MLQFTLFGTLFVISQFLQNVNGFSSFQAGLMILLGASMRLCMMPLNGHLLKSVPPIFVSRVTPLTSAMQQVMISFAVAGLTTILTSKARVYSGSSLPMAAGLPHAFADTFRIVMCLAFVGMALALLIPKHQKEESQPNLAADSV